MGGGGGSPQRSKASNLKRKTTSFSCLGLFFLLLQTWKHKLKSTLWELVIKMITCKCNVQQLMSIRRKMAKSGDSRPTPAAILLWENIATRCSCRGDVSPWLRRSLIWTTAVIGSRSPVPPPPPSRGPRALSRPPRGVQSGWERNALGCGAAPSVGNPRKNPAHYGQQWSILAPEWVRFPRMCAAPRGSRFSRQSHGVFRRLHFPWRLYSLQAVREKVLADFTRQLLSAETVWGLR